MTVIWTAQYRYNGPDRVDITTRRTHPQGAAFAPIWETMVGPYQNKQIDEAEYTKRYTEHMNTSLIHHTNAWKWLLSQLEVTLVCFCRPGAFCHRVILARDILAAPHFNGVIYRGERIPDGRW